jgi:hypothetical protein
VTAAERATATAEQGAAEHRAETDLWLLPEGIPTPDWMRAEMPTGEEDLCPAFAPGTGLRCLRRDGHPGRHIATGVTLIYAAWPGTHEPVEADLTAGAR